MTPPTDIVISVHGTRRYPIEKDFENCVNSIDKHTSHHRFIFVDDSSDRDGAAVVDAVASRYPSCVLVRTHKQRWFTRAYNLGLRLVRTPWVVAMNADCVVDAGWLEELYAVRDDVAAQCGRVGLVGSVMSAEEQRRWGLSINQDYVTGHCWLLSMEAISDVSVRRGTPGIYLDETRQDSIHIRSDVTLCWDLNRAGWATVKSFKAPVGHIGGRSWGFNLAEIGAVTLDQVNDTW